MAKSRKRHVIALEGHYWDPAVVEAWGPDKGVQPAAQLLEVASLRL